ncbi:hypothetical protein [Streptomyces caniscabiei]|uniref:Integral membrane protein n=1 Tax=Streptomyces caniscabiei TaxID=2746961 RepID=A0ABU4MPQ9_9ACTN|nr:hypothetical protein [Streptomyces caniscabiei]MDX2954586.1 hypothetical protein [Streptomyces caniscabiei]MDX3039436.1 hypothetical protein [Streptomyces caniscabiei]
MLPEHYQRYAQPAGQRVLQPREIELHDEHDPIVHVPDPYDPNRSVEVRRSALQPTVRPEPRDLTPQPLFDPLAQRMAGAGVGAGAAGAGIGWGVGQAAAGIAAIGGTTAVVVMLALWLLARAGRPSVHVRQEVHNHARWFGRNTTNL